MATSTWEPVPYRMRRALHRRQLRGALKSEGVICDGFRLSGAPLDVDRLNRAFALAVLAHPAVRTHFRYDPISGPQQRIGEPWADVLREVRVDGPAAVVEARAAEYIAGPGVDVFDLTSGRLIRPVLFTDGSTEHALVVSVDHTSCDGLSFGHIIDDVVGAYADIETAESTWRHPPYTLVDYAHAEAAFLGGPDGERQRAEWRERLDHEFPEMVLLRKCEYHELNRDAGAIGVTLTGDRFQQFQLAAATAGVTPYMYTVARLFEAMRPVVVSDKWSFIAPLGGRLRGSPPDLVGNMATLVPVTVRPPTEPGFPAVVSSVREGIVWALRHETVPAEKILADVAPGRRLVSECRQIFISGQHSRPPVFAGMTGREMPAPMTYAMFDLSVWLTVGTDELSLSAVYCAELLDRELVEGWLAHVTDAS